MVIDTSALVAILFAEPDAEMFEAAIADAAGRIISAASLLETSLVVEARYGDEGGRELDLLLYKAHLDIASVPQEQVQFARRAFRRFGKGRHPASLNFGDCLSYALAKSLAQTDVLAALERSQR